MFYLKTCVTIYLFLGTVAGTAEVTSKDNVVYDSRTEICCNGTLFPTGNYTEYCCGNKLYNTRSQICCEGNVIENPNWFLRCCGSQSYNLQHEVCCEKTKTIAKIPLQEKVDIKMNSYYYYECCSGVNNTVYEIQEYSCLLNETKLVKKPHRDYCKCGDSKLYEYYKEVCCDDETVLPYHAQEHKQEKQQRNDKQTMVEARHMILSPLHQSHNSDYYYQKCCGNKTYHIYYNDCCNGVVMEGNQICCNNTVHNITNNLNKCCGNKLYNNNNSTCCNGNLYLDEPEQHITYDDYNKMSYKPANCCGDKLKKVNQICCMDGPKNMLPGTNTTACCGTTVYDREMAVCCNNKTVISNNSKYKSHRTCQCCSVGTLY